ncbi:ATP-binding protein [bacterium]|nr:ATP-binding protein [bacterium]MBU1884529.1 ATP-binding protein [bacterium]
MELVYLWVEEYKNIKKQGFNFSPRFTCKYENDELTIIDKEETKEPYLKNFFGDNINVTAIVGENGSGKSGVLEAILNNVSKNGTKPLCLYDKKTNQLFSNVPIDKNSKLSKNLTTNLELNYKSSFFYHYKNDLSLPILDNSHAIYNEESFIFTEPNKNNNRLDIKIEEEKTLKKLINLVHDDFYKNVDVNEFFVPKVISLKVEEKRLEESIKKMEGDYLSKYKQIYNNQLGKKELLLLQNICYFHSLFSGYGDVELISDITFKKFNIDISSSTNREEIREEILRFYEQINTQSFLEQIENQEKELVKHSSSEAFNDKFMIFNELKKSLNLFKSIDKFFDLLQKGKDGTYTNWVLIDKLKNDENIKLLQNLPRFLKIDFSVPRIGGYYNLSSGEKIFLELLYSVRDIVNLREKNESSKNIFILLDEIENSLHPEWQKKLIHALISFIKIYKINIHLIVATHSPYILSDLPKENVIFLEKGKQVYPFENKQTFGANIHTLLSHGFFMKDGLMGEFAKEKINDAIKYLNKKELSKDEIEYCENIISIIGEPILKRQLQKMLDSKKLDKIHEIDELKNQIENLKNRLDVLEDNS